MDPPSLLLKGEKSEGRVHPPPFLEFGHLAIKACGATTPHESMGRGSMAEQIIIHGIHLQWNMASGEWVKTMCGFESKSNPTLAIAAQKKSFSARKAWSTRAVGFQPAGLNGPATSKSQIDSSPRLGLVLATSRTPPPSTPPPFWVEGAVVGSTPPPLLPGFF